MNLQGFKNDLANSLYGMTKEQAHSKGICIDCQKPIGLFVTEQDEAEYRISGLCSKCFDKSVGATEEETEECCTLKFQPSVTKTTNGPFRVEDFDPKYDFETIQSSHAFADAKARGEVVVLPEADELQIDIDNPEDYDVYLTNSERFDGHVQRIRYAKEAPSRNGGNGKHITVKLTYTIDDTERILLQLFLGSDRVRELLSYVRLLNDDPHPTLFIEKPEQKLLSEYVEPADEGAY